MTLFVALALTVHGNASAVQKKATVRMVTQNHVSTFLPDNAHSESGTHSIGANASSYASNGDRPRLKDLYAARTQTEFVDVFIELVNSRATNGQINDKGRYIIENKLAKYVERAFDARGGENGGHELTILNSKMKKELGVSAKLVVTVFDLKAGGRERLAEEAGTDLDAWKKGTTADEMLDIQWRELGKLYGGTRHRSVEAKSHTEGRGKKRFIAGHRPLMQQYVKVRADPSLDEATRNLKLAELENEIVGPWNE